ncbi:hypothetical protein GCM10027034_26510 [Ramlibacter solisilvae]|uniref:Uncharacterized protein n=1 Tax=Ramlibacter tataouinensis TaxID=94132 RepID=A0A127JQS6_9BURK|nr:DUF6709 family protein [Ramlibacter tataouinensis]AMO22321.1 hypothetical protein UC35_04685 [Ramlibacter tataouinensis]
MAANWLLEQVRRTSRNRIILAALVALGAAGVLAANATYLKEYFRGPALMTAAELERAPSLEALPRRWVRLDARAIQDTGMTEVTVRTKRGVERGRSVSASYHAALLDQRLILVRQSEEGSPGTRLTGELRPLEPRAVQALFNGKDGADLQALFLPMELELHDYRGSGHWLLLGALAAFVVAGYLALTGRAWMAEPHTHPALRKASAWGDLRALDAAVRGERDDAQQLGGWQIGANYLVRSSLLGLQLHNLNELLWAYVEVTKKKLYYVIPAGQTQALMLKWRGEHVKIDGKEDEVLVALQRIAEQHPWIVVGWTEDVKALYERQRASFATQVGKARQQWQQARAEAASAQAAPAPVPAARGQVPAALVRPGFEPTQPQPL